LSYPSLISNNLRAFAGVSRGSGVEYPSSENHQRIEKPPPAIGQRGRRDRHFAFLNHLPSQPVTPLGSASGSGFIAPAHVGHQSEPGSITRPHLGHGRT